MPGGGGGLPPELLPIDPGVFARAGSAGGPSSGAPRGAHQTRPRCFAAVGTSTPFGPAEEVYGSGPPRTPAFSRSTASLLANSWTSRKGDLTFGGRIPRDPCTGRPSPL